LIFAENGEKGKVEGFGRWRMKSLGNVELYYDKRIDVTEN
jgi:hypothetical protein